MVASKWESICGRLFSWSVILDVDDDYVITQVLRSMIERRKV
jgi:hypothetical protein